MARNLIIVRDLWRHGCGGLRVFMKKTWRSIAKCCYYRPSCKGFDMRSPWCFLVNSVLCALFRSNSAASICPDSAFAAIFLAWFCFIHFKIVWFRNSAIMPFLRDNNVNSVIPSALSASRIFPSPAYAFLWYYTVSALELACPLRYNKILPIQPVPVIQAHTAEKWKALRQHFVDVNCCFWWWS